MRLGTIAISSIAAVAIIALVVYLAMSGMAEADHGQSPHGPVAERYASVRVVASDSKNPPTLPRSIGYIYGHRGCVPDDDYPYVDRTITVPAVVTAADFVADPLPDRSDPTYATKSVTIRQAKQLYTVDIPEDPTWLTVYDRIVVKDSEDGDQKCQQLRIAMGIQVYKINRESVPSPAATREPAPTRTPRPRDAPSEGGSSKADCWYFHHHTNEGFGRTGCLNATKNPGTYEALDAADGYQKHRYKVKMHFHTH